MRILKLGLGLAGAALTLPTISAAQPVTGFYIGAGAGVNLVENTDVLSNRQLAAAARAQNFPTTGRSSFDPGFTGVVSAGYGFGFGLRAELEGSYRQNDAASSGTSTIPTGGTARSYAIMGNLLYDIRIPGIDWVSPYIGGGVGYAWRQTEGLFAAGNQLQAGVTSSDTVGAFAYQAIGGLSFPIRSVPGLSITTEYRYFATDTGSFNSRMYSTLNNATLGVGQNKSIYATHSALVGVRYAFGVARPAPAPAPVAAPAPARTFLVFFDWDRADLTDRARQIIAEAATNSRTVSSTRIEVSGHADRTGTAAYNQRLSVRRAEAVAAELVRRGVARNIITIQGFGFDRPLVPTAQGVREPQNRRVEIVLR